MFIVFFGSFADGTKVEYRDIDVAIYFNEEPDLLRHGHLAGTIEEIAGTKVDLVVLNGLVDKNPLLAHEIVCKHDMMPNLNAFSANEIHATYVTYRVSCIKHYEDTAYLRKCSNRAMKDRIKRGKFGSREYA
jgi:predicted nucleotidyltransferase